MGGALRVLGAPDAARAATVADARCLAPVGAIFGYGRQRFAETFKARHIGRPTQATVQLTGGSASVSNAYLIEIRTTTRTGKPTATVLASFQTPNMGRPANGITTPVVATFSPAASVKRDKRFALVLQQTNGGLTVQTSMKKCGGARFEDPDLDKIFVKDPGANAVFSTIVTI